VVLKLYLTSLSDHIWRKRGVWIKNTIRIYVRYLLYSIYRMIFVAKLSYF